jgi:ectoine hydroxylase-related dioxygenase (phytanoyl-CoA dioxygenase family)
MEGFLPQFQRDGYVIVRQLLSAAEADVLQNEARDLVAREESGGPLRANDNKQYGNADFAEQASMDFVRGCAMPEILNSVPLQALFADERVIRLVAACLGEGVRPDEVVLDNAVMLNAKKGTQYRQGWHRDAIGIVDEFAAAIAPMLQSDHYHNNVQINIALGDEDNGFWAVPGSHCRPYTAQEAEAFAHQALNKEAPLMNEMPGGVNLKLDKGDILLCNNNIIHRGACMPFETDRFCMHAGYSSPLRPPTWHIWSGERLSVAAQDDELMAGLDPNFARMIRRREAVVRMFPSVRDSCFTGQSHCAAAQSD